MADDYTFPADLIQLRRDFHQAGRDIDAYIVDLPRHATAMPEPYLDARGRQHEAHRGWTDDERAQVDQLRARERDLALQLTRHPWWLECGNRTQAGYALQQMIAREADSGEGAAGADRAAESDAG